MVNLVILHIHFLIAVVEFMHILKRKIQKKVNRNAEFMSIFLHYIYYSIKLCEFNYLQLFIF